MQIPPSLTVLSCVESDRAAPEDAVRVVQTAGTAAFAVADGAGGIGGGARAARLVVDGFTEIMGEVEPRNATPGQCCEFLVRLDAQIQRDSEAGESTAVVAVVRENQVVGASVGDSEAWVMGGDGNCEILTSSQRRSRIGSGQADPVGFRATVAGATLLVATDGLFHAAQAETIRTALLGEPTPEMLVSLARSRSGRLYDDVALVLVSVG